MNSPRAPLDLRHFDIPVMRDWASKIAALERDGFKAHGRLDLPAHPFHLPFDWNGDPFGDRNWMFQLHAWRMLDPYLNRLKRAPEHPRAWTDCIAILADWHRDNICGRPSRFTWYDFSAGQRALRLAFLIESGRRKGFVFPDPAMIANLIWRHLEELRDPAKLNHGNHGLFQLHGLMALATVYAGHPDSPAARSYAASMMSNLIDRQLGPQGVHTEDSPDYHFFATAVIKRLLNAPWWRRLRETSALKEKQAAAQRARYWLVDPAGRCLPVGDSTEAVRLREFSGLEEWPHDRRGTVLGAVVNGYGVVRTKPAVPLERSAILFLTASFHSTGHKHADCLSFIWQEGGENILIDSGKYGYQSDPMRDYFTSARAHNTVEIGKGFRLRPAETYGSGLRRVVPFIRSWLIEAEAHRPYAGVRHRRCVFFRPHRYVLAVDHIVFGQADSLPLRIRNAVRWPRRFISWWHFDPDHAVDLQGRKAVVSGVAGKRRLWVTHRAQAGPAVTRLECGARSPRLQGWVSRGYRQAVPAPALGFSVRTRKDYFAATLFELSCAAEGPKLHLSRDASGARISLAQEGVDAGGVRGFGFGDFALEIGEALL